MTYYTEYTKRVMLANVNYIVNKVAMRLNSILVWLRVQGVDVTFSGGRQNR